MVVSESGASPWAIETFGPCAPPHFQGKMAVLDSQSVNLASFAKSFSSVVSDAVAVGMGCPGAALAAALAVLNQSFPS